MFLRLEMTDRQNYYALLTTFEYEEFFSFIEYCLLYALYKQVRDLYKTMNSETDSRGQYLANNDKQRWNVN